MITKQFPIYFTHVNGFGCGLLAVRCDSETEATFVYIGHEQKAANHDWYKAGVKYVEDGDWRILSEDEIKALPGMSIKRKDERHTECVGPNRMTVRQVREWLATLPPEFQDAPFESMGGMPTSLKRIVAYQDKEGNKGVVTNPIGSHLPFDESLEWKHILS